MHLDANDFAQLDDAQRLAILETMVVSLVADDKVTPAEVQRFDEILFSLPWGVEREVLGGMIKGVHARLAALKSPAQIHDYVANLATRLTSPVLRKKVIFTMATLMWADGEMNRVEKNVLGLFSVAFNITSDDVAAIREALSLPPIPAVARPGSN
jgi:uncharacterized tellurite resistance protein B-like protein